MAITKLHISIIMSLHVSTCLICIIYEFRNTHVCMMHQFCMAVSVFYFNWSLANPIHVPSVKNLPERNTFLGTEIMLLVTYWPDTFAYAFIGCSFIGNWFPTVLFCKLVSICHTYLPTFLPACLPAYLPICLPVCPSVHLYIYLSVLVCLCWPVSVCVCVCVCVCV